MGQDDRRTHTASLNVKRDRHQAGLSSCGPHCDGQYGGQRGHQSNNEPCMREARNTFAPSRAGWCAYGIDDRVHPTDQRAPIAKRSAGRGLNDATEARIFAAG